MMRAAIQVLFLVFYVGSSYVTSQHRVSYIVHKLEHFNARGTDTALADGCKERVRYTRFREAKKAGVDFYFMPDMSPRFVPLVSTRRFVPQTISLQSQFDVETSHSRAPPM
jgi:hypothetical protein